MSATRTDGARTSGTPASRPDTTSTDGVSAVRQPDRIVRSGAPEQRFRAATVDEAVAQARAALGPDAEIVEANRIRRGGIGGFFATELGVEIVARGASTAERADVFEPFDGRPLTTAGSAVARSPQPTPTVPTVPTVSTVLNVPSAPPIRAWTVDQGLGAHIDAQLVADPSMPPTRARQMWRDAAREPATDAQLPGMETVGRPSDPADAAPEPTTFAEHFLRELVQDAEQLRRTPDRNRMLPVRETPVEQPDARDARDARDETVPPRRRTASMFAPAATEPIGDQEPLAGMPAPRPEPSATGAMSPDRPDRPERPAKPVAEEPQTLPGMPAPTPKRRQRRGTGTTKSTATRRAEAEAAAAAAAAQVAAAQVAAAEPARAMVGELIEQCVALTSSADASVAPSKIALAVTLPDGSVMKVSIERPRRAGRPARDAAGA